MPSAGHLIAGPAPNRTTSLGLDMYEVTEWGYCKPGSK